MWGEGGFWQFVKHQIGHPVEKHTDIHKNRQMPLMPPWWMHKSYRQSECSTKG